MDPVVLLASSWLLFAATHLGLSSQRLRPRLIDALGAQVFQGLYSLVSLAIFVPLVWLYFANKHAGPYLWNLSGLPGVRPLVYVGMGAAFALIVAGLLRQSPASVLRGPGEVRGVYHVTRHPLLMGFGLFGLLHLAVATVNAAELVFFAGFPIFVWIGCRHQDARKLASGEESFRAFYVSTPFVPFSRPAGVLRALREQPVAIALGVGVAIALRWFHPQLFGPG